MRELFGGASTNEADTSRAMLATLNETGHLIDPHTAVAISAARRTTLSSDEVPLIVLSTAHAAKFPEAVHAATGVTPRFPRADRHLADKPERYDRLPADAAVVMDYVRSFAGA
jgi:threonine synthase